MKHEVTKPIGLLLIFVIMFLHVLFHKMIELSHRFQCAVEMTFMIVFISGVLPLVGPVDNSFSLFTTLRAPNLSPLSLSLSLSLYLEWALFKFFPWFFSKPFSKYEVYAVYLGHTAAQRDKNALSDTTNLDNQKTNYYSSYDAAVAAIKKNPNQRAYYLAGQYTASEWAALKGQLTIGNSTEPLLSSTYYQFVVRAHSGVRISAVQPFFIYYVFALKLPAAFVKCEYFRSENSLQSV